VTPPESTAGESRCEICGREPAISFSWFADPARWYADQSGTWKFAGACSSERELYYVFIRGRGQGFFDSVQSRERWLAHLSEKRWFDRTDFDAMLRRYGAAGGSLAFGPRPKGRRAQRLRLNLKPARSKGRELPHLDSVDALPSA
jgi:hypothetical protein